MEQLDLFIEQFYALPQVASVVNSNGILRLAVLQYGKPLFLITCAFLFLVTILLISRLKPKKGRPKKIKEPKVKKAKAAKPARHQKKPAGTPKSVMKNLAKIPDSPLPLYPVADKRKPLSIDDGSVNGDPATAIMPVVDDQSLIAGLDSPEMALDAPKPMVSSQPVQSFTLDSTAAAAMTGAPSTPSPTPEEDFIMPVATENVMDDHDDGVMDDLVDDFDNDQFAVNEDGNDLDADPDLDINADFGTDFGGDLADNFEDDANSMLEDDFEDDDAADEDNFAPLYEPEETASPKHEVTVDISPIGGDDFDMPVGSFGGGAGDSGDDASETGGLSPSAQQKLAELNERGTT